MAGTYLAPESPDVVWFGGADATRFLNDLISQEIGDMAVGESRRSFLLGPQGKLDHLLWVLRDEEIGLLTDPGRGEALAATLGRYRIRVDVVITPETAPVWLVVGEWSAPGGSRVFDVSWRAARRTLVIGDQPDVAEGTVEQYELERVTSGEPRWGVDVDDSTIPHESGLVPLAVDFGKGCFLGQELVARIDSRGGNTPRRLRLVDFSEAASSGTVTTRDGSDGGVVTSVADGVGLGLLHRSVSAGDEVQVDGRVGVVREIVPEPTG